jgi:capsular exopolysaccharide synthesis family protein
VTEHTIVLPPDGSGGTSGANYRLTMMVPKRRYLSYLRERWWVVMVCLAVTVGTVLIYETVRTETFESLAQLHVTGEVQITSMGNFGEDQMNYFGTQVELLKSPRLQGQAFEKAGIPLPPPDKKNPYKIDVFQPMKTSILQLLATGPDANLTQRFLEALIEEYKAYKKDAHQTSSEEVLASITDTAAKKDKELKLEQDKFGDFLRTNNIAVIEEEAKIAGLRLAELDRQLDSARIERALLQKGISLPRIPGLETVSNQDLPTWLVSDLPVSSAPFDAYPWPSSPANGAGLAADPGLPAASRTASSTTNAPAPTRDNALRDARVELAVLRQARSEKSATLPDRHPFMVKLDDEIRRWETTVAILEAQYEAQKQKELEDVETRIQWIEAMLPPLETRVRNVNDRLSESQRMKNSIQREQGLYERLLGVLQSVDVNKNVQQERLSVLQTPTPARPSKRYLPIRIAVAVFAGLSMSLGLVFVWYLADDRFVSAQDIRDQFGEPVLGLVPHIRIPRRQPQAALFQAGDPRLAYVESFRQLRSALLLSTLGKERPHTLLLTGAVSGEGKTTIAVNLARLMARSGMRVVLLDADIQRGVIQRLLGLGDLPGVMDYLRGDAPIQSVLHPTNVPGLSLVPAGTHADEAEGIFLRPNVSELMKELKTDRDFVIIDSPPILASDAAALLVPHVDTVLLVVRPFFTRGRLIRQTLDMLYQRQAKQVAIVLNRARKDDLTVYYARNGIPLARRNGKT